MGKKKKVLSSKTIKDITNTLKNLTSFSDVNNTCLRNIKDNTINLETITKPLREKDHDQKRQQQTLAEQITQQQLRISQNQHNKTEIQFEKSQNQARIIKFLSGNPTDIFKGIPAIFL